MAARKCVLVLGGSIYIDFVRSTKNALKPQQRLGVPGDMDAIPYPCDRMLEMISVMDPRKIIEATINESAITSSHHQKMISGMDPRKIIEATINESAITSSHHQ